VLRAGEADEPAAVHLEAAPLAVNHSSVFPSVTFSFNLAPGVALGDAVKLINATEAKAGMPSTITGSFSGRAQAFTASLLRFRPIMMTTMAALLGGVPLAVGMGMGSELRRPLGITIVGGLTVSQMLTLYTTPVIYLYMDRLNLWISKFGFASPPEGGGHRGARRDVMRRGNGMNNALSGLLRTAARRAGDSRRL